MNEPKAMQVSSDDSALLSFAQKVSEVPLGPAQQVLQSFGHYPAALVVTSGRRVAQRWPALMPLGCPPPTTAACPFIHPN